MKTHQINLTQLLTTIFCAAAVVSCGTGPDASTPTPSSSGQTLASLEAGATASSSTTTGTDFSDTSSGATGASGTSASAPSGAASLSISTFVPPTNWSLQSLPALVQVFFNETNLTSSVSNPANWTVSCSCGYVGSATQVTFSGLVASVSLPTPTCPQATSSNTCTVMAASNIQDTFNNFLVGTSAVTYTVVSSTGSSLDVRGFSPASGSALASSIGVTFSMTSMAASTVTNPANWSLACTNGSTYAIPSVTYSSAVATVQMPAAALALAAGSTCTLTASAAITDSGGDPLATMSATYTTGASSSSSGSPTQVGTAGGNGGSPVADVSGAAGTSLAGINVIVGASYVTQIGPEWSDASGTLTASGQVGPGTDSSGGTTNLTCPSASGYRASGVFGTLTNGGCGGGSQSCVQSIGLICSVDSSVVGSAQGSGSRFQTAIAANASDTQGSTYSLVCPSGTFITMLYGRSGDGVDQIGIGCQ